MARVVMSFTFDSQKDRRILRYLEGLPKGERSAAIRDALYACIGRGDVTLGDVYQAVRDLDRKLESGSVLVQHRDAGAICQKLVDEPADVAASLDGLGL